MNFKLSSSDFTLLSQFIENRCKGSDLTINTSNPSILKIQTALTTGEIVDIKLFQESANAFPKVTIERNLGDEVK